MAFRLSEYGINHSLEAFDKMTSYTTADRRRSNLDRLASSIAILELAGCFRRGKRQPRSKAKIIALASKGLRRPHPAMLEDSACLKRSQELRKAVAESKTSKLPQLASLLSRLHSLRTSRCLLP